MNRYSIFVVLFPPRSLGDSEISEKSTFVVGCFNFYNDLLTVRPIRSVDHKGIDTAKFYPVYFSPGQMGWSAPHHAFFIEIAPRITFV